jgi:hypothetical protein
MINARLMRTRVETPMDLKFSVVEQHRVTDLLAEGFVSLDDRFDSAKGLRGYDLYAPGPENRPAKVDRRHSTVSLSGDEPFFTLFRSETHQDAPFTTVIADVVSFAGTGGEQDAAFVGLVKDDANYIVAWFSHVSGAAGIDAVVDGELQTLGGVDQLAIHAPCRVAFSLTGTEVGALIDTGTGFKPLLRAHLPANLTDSNGTDLRKPAALAEYRNAFGARASSGTVRLGGVQAGYFGQTGVRDPHVVTYADGSPYIKYGKVFLTMSNGGLAFFETGHWAVWTLDLRTHHLESVGKMFFRRDGSESLQGDHAGHLVRDEENDRWVVATSTWGDFAGDRVDVHYATVPLSTDLLHGVHVLETQLLKLPVDGLPTAAVGQWDPHLVRIDDRWYVGFVNAREFFDFYPALACGEPGGDFTDLSLVGCDPSKSETEGVILQHVDGRWFVLASNGDNSPDELRNQYPVYDLTMAQVGTLNAPHPSNIPWPMLFPTPASRDRTRWMMVTFDGTAWYRDVLGYGTHGKVLVMQAKPLTQNRQPAR